MLKAIGIRAKKKILEFFLEQKIEGRTLVCMCASLSFFESSAAHPSAFLSQVRIDNGKFRGKGIL
jgi:hypothetical protein